METCMKKRIFKFITLFLALCMTLFASACDSDNTLLFNNNFLGNAASGEAPTGYKETLTYNVELKPEQNSLSVNPSFKEHGIEYNFNGTYTMEFSSGIEQLPSGVESSVTSQYQSQLYCLKTKLELTAWYKIDGTYADGGVDKDGGKEYQDVIETTVFFLPAGYAFAPIYSTANHSFTNLFVGNGDFRVNRTEYSYKTTYQTDNYATTMYLGDKHLLDRDCKYEFKSVIDNNQLLFALRNIDVAVDNIYELPTVSTSYPEPKTLNVMNLRETSRTVTVNGLGENVTIPVMNLRFNVKEGLNTGLSQYALVQKNTIDSSNPKALLIEYSSPLVSDGTYLIMGALVYSLNSVSYSK